MVGKKTTKKRRGGRIEDDDGCDVEMEERGTARTVRRQEERRVLKSRSRRRGVIGVLSETEDRSGVRDLSDSDRTVEGQSEQSGSVVRQAPRGLEQLQLSLMNRRFPS